jgi:hypothetical protein
MYKKVLASFIIGIYLIFGLPAWAFWPQETEDAWVLRGGEAEFVAGVEYLENRQLEFTAMERDRELLKLPAIGLRFGFGGKSEFQFNYEAEYLDEQGGESEYGSGDLRVWNKISFTQESGSFPAVGFRWGVKLPNADDEDRLGTDETDFFTSMLFSKHIGPVLSHLNLGLAILGDSLQNSHQDDLLSYGIAVEFPIRNTSIWGEVTGLAGSHNNNNFSTARLGLNWERGPWTWVAALGTGLAEESEDWSIRGGMLYSFGPR